jgi:CubicO group peptidase (beta-lactamase class C family)
VTLKKRRAILFVVCVSVILASQAGFAQPSTVPATSEAASPASSPDLRHEMSAADVEAFLDGFVPMQLQRENIAGAVVLVVKDGKVLFSRGYGYSNVEKRTPISPDATLFRPGSISKLFTWTAVMQLVEQGKLDLDKDVNTYLDFKIPSTFPQPITLRNILTHTPGFEEQIKNLINSEGAPIATLRQHLVQHVPERIFAPGTTPAYSNYGAALAGYIVERVSGKPFNDYVNENIFQPLGMAHSTFAQPLPADLKPFMSTGYSVGSGKAKPFEIVEEAPAGALSATAADISRFMIAQLQDGKLDNAQILRPETAQAMHARQPGLSPALNAMCLGFYEESRNGHRIIGHGGDTIYFHSDLHLILDSGVGFFVSYNSGGKHELSPRGALWTHFLDRYFPYTPPAATKLATAEADAKTVAGRYMTTRRQHGNFLRVASMLDEINVTAEPDGNLKVDQIKDYSGEVKKWQEISPLLYRAVNGQELIAFRRDEKGRLQMLPNFPAACFQRATFLQDGRMNQTLIIACLCVMALTLLFWPVGAVVRDHYHQRIEMDPGTLQGRLWIRMVCALDLIFFLALVAVVSSDDPGTFSDKRDLPIHLIQGVGVLGVLGTVLVFIGCLRSWADSGLWWWNKFWNLVVLAAQLGFVWFVLYWNMLDFNLNY